MNKKSLILGMVSTLILTGGVFLGSNTQANTNTTHDLNKLANMKIVFDVAPTPAQVDQNVAIENAKKEFGMTSTAKAIKVEYHLVTDPNVTQLPSQVLSKHPEFSTKGMNRLPAFVISFEGLDIPSHAPKGWNVPHNTELNVIVDGETGTPITAFAYR